MQMEAVNKATMDAMMERKNAFAAAAGRPKPAHQPDKENTSLLANFFAQCAATLLAWPETIVAVMAMSMLV